MNAETIKGFSDSTGEEAIKRERIRKILVESFELFGFESAETPVIEYEEFVRGKILKMRLFQIFSNYRTKEKEN